MAVFRPRNMLVVVGAGVDLYVDVVVDPVNVVPPRCAARHPTGLTIIFHGVTECCGSRGHRHTAGQSTGPGCGARGPTGDGPQSD